jgi:hypothetical protein
MKSSLELRRRKSTTVLPKLIEKRRVLSAQLPVSGGYKAKHIAGCTAGCTALSDVEKNQLPS